MKDSSYKAFRDNVLVIHLSYQDFVILYEQHWMLYSPYKYTMYTSTSVSLHLVCFQSKCSPDITGSCNDSLPGHPSESSPPKHKLQLPPSLPIPICWSSSTHDNQSKLSQHSFTAVGRSYSKIHLVAHPLNIKLLFLFTLFISKANVATTPPREAATITFLGVIPGFYAKIKYSSYA
jgi:hypothetical protein